MSEIKRCPFCGGEGEVHEYNSFWYKAGCNNQKCFLYITAQVFNSKEKAVEAWNTRKPMKNIVKRLEKEGQTMSEAKSMVKYGKASPSSHRYYKAVSVKKAIKIVKEEGGVK